MLVTTNPAFAEEVRAMADFDEFLDSSALSRRFEDDVDTGFLANMQKQMAESITTNASVGTVIAEKTSTVASGTRASNVATASASLFTKAMITKTLVVAALCGTVGVGVWKYNTSQASNEAIPTQTQQGQNTLAQNTTTEASAEKPLQTSQNQEQSNATSKQAAQSMETTRLNSAANAHSSSAPTQSELHTESATHTSTQQAATQPTVEQELHSSLSTDANNKQREVVEQLMKQLREYEAAGDNTSAAFTLKRLGMTLREYGVYDESANYFAKALRSAQNQRLKELEGEVLAEQAKLFRVTGNREKALAGLREAVKIFTETSSNNLNKWKNELERWEKQ